MKKHISEMKDRELDVFVKTLLDKPNIAYDPKDWRVMKSLLDEQFPLPPGHWNHKIIWTFLGFFAVIIGLIMVILTHSQGIDPLVGFPDTKISSTFTRQDFPNFVNLHPEMLAPTQDPAIPSFTVTSNDFPKGTKNLGQKIEVKSIPIQGMPEFPAIPSTFVPRITIQGKEVKNPAVKRSVNDSRNDPGPYKFSIGLLIAPEMSTVQMNQLHHPGRSIHLNLEYYIHEKWSLNTGIIHSYKTYTGGDGYRRDYQPSPYGFQGDCWVIDIPFNFRYYALEGSHSKWFISSGVSSYFMLREEYELQYEGYGGDRYSVVEAFQGNRHFFNVVNLSVGYQRKLGQRLALHAEPYFKIPVAGIGEELLSLKSAGVFLGINYYW
jgi:hypothetical protein